MVRHSTKKGQSVFITFASTSRGRMVAIDANRIRRIEELNTTVTKLLMDSNEVVLVKSPLSAVVEFVNDAIVNQGSSSEI